MCSKLLHHLEDLFGVPESEASKSEAAKIEALSAYASDSETIEEREATVKETSKGETSKEDTFASPQLRNIEFGKCCGVNHNFQINTHISVKLLVIIVHRL